MTSDAKSWSDLRQTVRMRRYFMAAGTSVLAIGVLAVWHGLGMLGIGAFVVITATIVVLILGFYAVFRTGLNRRCQALLQVFPDALAAPKAGRVAPARIGLFDWLRRL